MRRTDIDCTYSGFADRKDRFLICDTMTELAERSEAGNVSPNFGDAWAGGLSKDMAGRFLREGEMARVASSDKYLSKLEDKFQFHAGRSKIADAVAGGAVNVPALLAGTPMAMRRRQRISDELAPLTIVADTASSANISAYDLEKRGAAILALVRILSALRPVTLYAGTIVGSAHAGTNKDGLLGTFTRIETSPLDLARAAFLLAHPGAARAIGYGVSMHEFKGDGSYIPWSFGDANAARKYGPEALARVFPGTELLYLPSVFAKDASIKEPEKWLLENVNKFGGLENEAGH